MYDDDSSVAPTWAVRSILASATRGSNTDVSMTARASSSELACPSAEASAPASPLAPAGSAHTSSACSSVANSSVCSNRRNSTSFSGSEAGAWSTRWVSDLYSRCSTCGGDDATPVATR